MNKLTKLLSVFVIAGAIGTGVAGVAGCAKPNSGDGHDYTYTQIVGNAEKHTVHCKAEGHDEADTQGDHEWENGKCKLCDYAQPGQEVTAPATADGIIVEYEGGIADITLSETNKTASFDISKIKVYYAAGTTKLEAVPAGNIDLSVTKDGDALTDLTGLKQGHYEFNVDLVNVKTSAGGNATWSDFIAVDIKNPVKADSLVVKNGTLTQTAGVDTIKSTWTYEVTLANGDKQDVAAANVTVSNLDTMFAGADKTANLSCTINGTAVTGTVKYTITADTNKVAQSYALNFNTLTADQIKASGGASVDGGRFVVASNKAEIAGHNASFDGKYIANRFKAGGQSNSKDNTIYIKVKVDGAATITVYNYSNTGSADKLTGRKVTLTSGYKSGTEYGTVIKEYDTYGKVDEKHVFTVTEAGEYYILAVGGDICFTYVQIDQMVSADGNQEVVLGGTMNVSALELNTSSAKKVYKVNDTIDTSGVTASTVGVNSVSLNATSTPVANADLKFSTVDTSTTGEKEVTVTYGEGVAAVSEKYKVTVETAVDGVKGAKVKALSAEVATADAKHTFNKNDLEVTLDWTKEAVTGLTTSYVVKYDGVAIDSTKEFAVGEYTLTVEVTVANADGSQTATITVEVTLEVTKKLAEGEVAKASFNASNIQNVGSGITVSSSGLVLGDEAIAKVTALSECKVNASNAEDYTQRLQTAGAANKAKKAVQVELKAKATITIVYKKATADTRVAGLYDSDGKVLQQDTENGSKSDNSTLFTYTFTAVEAGTYLIGGTNGINIYEIIITPAE